MGNAVATSPTKATLDAIDDARRRSRKARFKKAVRKVINFSRQSFNRVQLLELRKKQMTKYGAKSLRELHAIAEADLVVEGHLSPTNRQLPAAADVDADAVADADADSTKNDTTDYDDEVWPLDETAKEPIVTPSFKRRKQAKFGAKPLLLSQASIIKINKTRGQHRNYHRNTTQSEFFSLPRSATSKSKGTISFELFSRSWKQNSAQKDWCLLR